LVAGQSNAVSGGQGDLLTYYSQTGKTKVTDYYGNQGPAGVELIPTVTTQIGGSISWIFCGDFLNRNVTFVNIAVGGRSTTSWNNIYYASNMVPKLNSAEVYDAIIWVQGESDVGEGISEATTYANMKDMIQKSRTIRPGIRWIVALNSFTTTPAENPTRKAQRRIIYEGLADLGPDTDVLRLNPAYVESGGAEFANYAGFQAFGQVWADNLKKGFEP